MSCKLRQLFPLVFIAGVATSFAQSTRVWLDVYEPPAPFTQGYTSHVVACPGGGVVSASIGAQVATHSPGEAVVRRLSENGDVLWQFTRPLPTQDYIGLYGREYIAGLDVNGTGEVAIAFGGAGPMVIQLYESDGTLRWEASVSVITGPHFDGAQIGLAPNGDVLFASSENLFQGGTIRRFGLYRFAAADGQQLWMRGAPANAFPRLAVDAQGDAILAANRASTGGRTWTIERFDSQGTVVGSTSFDTDSSAGGVRDLDVDAAGRTVVMIGDALAGSVLSLDSTMAVEWQTQLPPAWFGSIARMADGDVVLTGVGSNWDLVRLDRATGAAHYAAANVVGNHFFAHAVGLPNGNCVVALSKSDFPGSLCVQERDPLGVVVREHVPATTDRSGSYGFALGARGNVYAAYRIEVPSGNDQGGLAKIVFDDEVGTPYCGPAVPNSTGQSATVRAVGTPVVAANNLSLVFAELPPGTTVLPIASQTMGFVAQPGGSQGELCLGGSVGRFDEPGEIRFADPVGAASMQVELLRMPTPAGLVPAVAGETWNFQAWFRDSVPTQPSTSNFTDAVSVVLR